ncbi:hypothetical protein HD554DRAFT_14920 [Boletus coccyginus]|nr:hypothetical protein HD554DRAFT_14920 [Boletus coccyginus]
MPLGTCGGSGTSGTHPWHRYYHYHRRSGSSPYLRDAPDWHMYHSSSVPSQAVDPASSSSHWHHILLSPVPSMPKGRLLVMEFLAQTRISASGCRDTEDALNSIVSRRLSLRFSRSISSGSAPSFFFRCITQLLIPQGALFGQVTFLSSCSVRAV